MQNYYERWQTWQIWQKFRELIVLPIDAIAKQYHFFCHFRHEIAMGHESRNAYQTTVFEACCRFCQFCHLLETMKHE